MRRSVISNGVVRLVGCWLAGMAVVLTGLAQDRAGTRNTSNEVHVVELSSPREVEVMRSGTTSWDQAYPEQILRPGDRIRTRHQGRATLRLSDQSLLRLSPLTEMIILPPEPKRRSIFRLLLGRLYFFHRDTPSDLRIDTPSAAGAVRGTEFVIEENENSRTTLTLFDGEVELSNAQGAVGLKSGERGVAEPGVGPTRTALLQADADRAIQWCLYYPGVLDLAELDLTEAEQQTLAESLIAYRNGDLLQALAKYPAGRQPGSASETLYLSALWLAVGQVDQTERLLTGLTTAAATNDRVARLSRALHTVIDATRFQTVPGPAEPESLGRLATEWLAESYARQAERQLEAALTAATRAAERSPQFGFAWARAAELEFGFGRIRRASDHLKRSLELSPQNAQALALQGFLLSAENKIGEAIQSFGRAMAVDGALGNAWLGRGLCRIRKNQSRAGREDLAVAAALEPQRAALRSYLGKTYSDAGDDARARHELSLARKLDVNDPTSWLYSALHNQQRNRINEAIRDLEKSQELNDNRSVYRSHLLLDQDRAVRSANLARIYQDAGMDEVALREAGRAVSYDYANYSAHLFLANSYDQMRDPNRINLRYETPAESEYLIANLLAPVGAGLLAQSVSQQEYSKLFERDRLGVASTTEYLSRGAWTERGAQYGTFRDSSYLFEGNYRTDPGQRPNNDFEEMELRLHLKQQLTPQDTLYFRGVYYDAEGGDVRQYYDPNNASAGLRTEETQEPILHLGYHHEWSPGLHTLLLAGWLNDRYSVQDPLLPTLLTIGPPGEPPIEFHLFWANSHVRTTQKLYTAEAQQIWQRGDHNTILGGRFQAGEIRSEDLQTFPVVALVDPAIIVGYFDPSVPLAEQDLTSEFQRASLYGYHYWQILPPLQLVAGLSYDRVTFPENFRAPPFSDATETRDQLSPKAGFIWTPTKSTAVRFAYTRSLAGASLDQTFLLEPSQVAGFNQSFRSIIPESISGANAGAEFETFGLAWDQKIGVGTYVGVSGQILNSDVDRTLGTFRYDGSTFFAFPSGTTESLDYRERSLVLSLHQLVRNEWSFGVAYRLVQADLEDDFTEMADSTLTSGVRPRQDLTAVLHQVALQSGYYHPYGFFAVGQALWTHQNNQGYSPDIPGDDFWQLNVFVGYRFPRRQAEVRLGLLNLTDQDYRLNPLTLYNELPRSRTLAVRLQLSF